MNEFNRNLTFPDTMFINCTASYVVSAYNYFCDIKSKNDIFYFLLSCDLRYLPIDIRKAREQFNNNPWGFQLVKVYNSDGIPLFQNTSFLDFLLFLEKSFDIKAEVVSNHEDINIIDCIISQFKKRAAVIISIDEYFNPKSERFYNIAHNNHSLLIKKIDYLVEMFEVIDSESSEVYMIDFKDVESATKKSVFNNYHITLLCEKFTNYLEEHEKFIDMLLKKKFPELLKDFSEGISYYFFNYPYNVDYIYKGVHFSILFKIIPFIKMRTDFFSKNIFVKEETYSFIKTTNTLLDLWNNLSYIMLRGKYNNNYSIKLVLKRLEDICNLERKLNELLQEYAFSRHKII